MPDPDQALAGVKIPQQGLRIKVSLFRGHLGDDLKTVLNESTQELSNLLRLTQNSQTLLSSDAHQQFQKDSLQINSLKYRMRMLAIQVQQNTDEFRKLRTESEGLQKKINTQMVEALPDTLTTAMAASAARLRHLKQIARELNYTRYGFKLDVAAGWVYSFPNESFQAGSATKFGTWVTFSKLPYFFL